METKTCAKCHEPKPLTDYYKDKRATDGLYSHCKACHYKMTHAYEQSAQGKEIVRKSKRANYYERGGKEKHRLLSSKESARQQRREYERSEAGKAASRRKSAKRRALFNDRIQAKRAVRTAVANGTLPPVTALVCRQCGKPAAEYHHPSYEKDQWLVVVPLCKLCHAATYTDPY